MVNWKTTTFGVVGAVGLGLPAIGVWNDNETFVKVCNVVAALGSLGVAVYAKDKDTPPAARK